MIYLPVNPNLNFMKYSYNALIKTSAIIELITETEQDKTLLSTLDVMWFKF